MQTRQPRPDPSQSSCGPQHYWSNAYVQQMRALLGQDACWRLAIYALPENFLLSVVVPIFNECDMIGDVIDRLRATGLPMQMILVDDGSTDGTSTAVDALGTAPDITVVHHQQNFGKGVAIRSGIKHARGDVIVIQDADHEYDPADFRVLLQPILAGQADVAYGTRYGHYDRQISPWWHQAVNQWITTLASVAIGLRLSDIETCYKMAPRRHFESVLSELREARFGIEIELTARWARRGLRFTERPIRYQHRWYDAGKKIGWRDGFSALRCIVQYGVLRR